MLSKRERNMGIAAVLILSALVADRFIVTPALEKLRQVEAQKLQLQAELNEARSLFDRRRLMEKKWRQLLAEGLKSGSEVESRVLHAVDQWARDSQLTLTSVKPERTSALKKGLHEMTFSVASRGTLEAATRFLWLVEKASLPVAIKDMQLGSANESGGEMSLQLRLSALYIGDQGPESGDEHGQDS
ncbi:MAG: hypothetical protein ACYTBJ_13015 [Planctomycetota bacterium]|jgi:hypothetical protein